MLKRIRQSGFTLIELVIVIAVIGILAAIAIPKFMNVSANAETAATSAIAGTLASANANNYAARSLSSSLGAPVADCQHVGELLQGGLPQGYTITPAAIGNGITANCTVNGPNSTSATFQGTGIS